jgi:hypothetical protein
VNGKCIADTVCERERDRTCWERTARVVLEVFTRDRTLECSFAHDGDGDGDVGDACPVLVFILGPEHAPNDMARCDMM